MAALINIHANVKNALEHKGSFIVQLHVNVCASDWLSEGSVRVERSRTMTIMESIEESQARYLILY